MPKSQRRLKIIVFTASYGGGHNSVASALADGFNTYYPKRTNVEVLDYMQKFAPHRDAILRALYRKSTKYFPWTYDLFFDASDHVFSGSLGRKLGAIGEKEVKEFLDKSKPDIVISVYPMPGHVIPGLGLKHPPLTATVVTDFGVHSQWVHPDTDLYFVASDEVKNFLQSVNDIPSDRIKITGIPLRLSFNRRVNKQAIRKRFNISPKFTVLLMSGEQHRSDIKSVCDKLSGLPIQIIALCGKNKRMFRKVAELSRNNSKIIPFGFTKEIDQLMQISDVLIGKAGGITVSEALACSLPVIVFRPYPGQEKYNVDYILKHKAGYLANKDKEVLKKAEYLYRHKNRLKQLQRNAGRLGHPDATKAVCKIIMDEFSRRHK